MHALFMRIAIGCAKHFLPCTTGKRLSQRTTLVASQPMAMLKFNLLPPSQFDRVIPPLAAYSRAWVERYCRRHLQALRKYTRLVATSGSWKKKMILNPMLRSMSLSRDVRNETWLSRFDPDCSITRCAPPSRLCESTYCM